MSRTIEKNCMRLYGCSYPEALSANAGLCLRSPGTKARLYDHQRHTARRRGISWEITFVEWVLLWNESGHFHQRGRGAGCYCMARHGDVGPYRVGNVSIQPIEVNSRDALAKTRTRINLSASARSRRGTGRGWTYISKTKKRPYQVCISNRYVGSYATQAEAEAAYAAAV